MRIRSTSEQVQNLRLQLPDPLRAPAVNDPLSAQLLQICDRRLSEGAASPDVTSLKLLLFLDKHVRTQALKLLHGDASSSPQQRTALALCILEAGTRIEMHDKIAPEVARLLSDRHWSKESYWDGIEREHSRGNGPDIASGQKEAPDAESADAGPPKAFRGRGLPFFHADEKYSRENLNGRIDTDGGLNEHFSEHHFVCRQLAQAVKDSPEEVLQALARHDVSQLDQAALDLAANTASPTINFTSQNFGKQLIRLAIGMEPGCKQSHRVKWSTHEIAGHDMRVFLEKPDADSETIKVALYNPNVTGDVCYLEAYPEDLRELTFDDFDALGNRCEWNVPVLSLSVQDPQLAAACAGAFVPDDVPTQIASAAEALADNNVEELALMLEQVRGKCQGLDDVCVSRLKMGLHWAMRLGHAPAIELLMRELNGLGFNPDQIASIASADDSAYSGLYAANVPPHEWQPDMIRAYMAGLKRLNIGAEQLTRIVAGVGFEGGNGFDRAMQYNNVAGVKEMMQGLQGVRLTPDLVNEIFGWSCMNALFVGLERGNHAVAEVFLNGLKSLDIDGNELNELFSSLGPSDLHKALKGPPGSITVLMDGIQGLRPRLGSAQILDFAAQRKWPMGTILFEALSTGNTRAVKEIMNGLRGLELNTVNIARLVAGSSDQSGVTEARKNGCHEALKAFEDGLLELGFSAEQIPL